MLGIEHCLMGGKSRVSLSSDDYSANGKVVLREMEFYPRRFHGHGLLVTLLELLLLELLLLRIIRM